MSVPPSCCKQPAFRLVCILATAAGSRDRIPRRAENMQALLRHMCAHARLLYIQREKGFRICVLSLALSLRDGEPPHCSCAWDGGGGRCLLLPLFAHSELRRRYVSPAAAALFTLPIRRVLPAHYYPLAVTPPPSDLQNHPHPPAHVRNMYRFFVPSPTASPELITIHKLYQANLIYSVCSRLLLRANNSNKAPLIVCLFAFAGPPSTTSIHRYFTSSFRLMTKANQRRERLLVSVVNKY